MRRHTRTAAFKHMLAAAVALACPLAALGAVNLELRPLNQIVNLGDPADLGLFAVSDDAGNQSMTAADVVIGWDPTYLELIGLDQFGASPDVLAAAFPPDAYGVNEANPPADGDGLIQIFGPFVGSITATPAGTLLTTLLFDAIAQTPLTTVQVLTQSGTNQITGPAMTTVFNGLGPAVTGTLGSANITIVPEPTTLLLLGVFGLMAGARMRR